MQHELTRERVPQGLNEAAWLLGDGSLRVRRAYLAGCSHGSRQGWMSSHQLLGSVQRQPGSAGLPLTWDWNYRD